MPRFAQSGTDANGQPVLRPFTAEEEAQRDAEEAAALLPPTAAQVRAADILLLRNVTGDTIVLLIRLIQRLMVSAPTLIKPADFSVAVRQAYTDAKVIADRLDPPP